MVYKIVGNFTDDNFSKIIGKISTIFKSIYINNTLYIGLSKIENKDKVEPLIKKTFRPVKDFYIQEINEKNIMDEERFLMEWCRDILLDLDKQRFEKEQQEKLRETWEAMNRLEEDLRNQLLSKAASHSNNKVDSEEATKQT